MGDELRPHARASRQRRRYRSPGADPGYERLLSSAGSLTANGIDTQRVLNGLLDLGIRQRVEAFEEAVKDLDAQIARWSGDAVFTVADTSMYIEHEQKLRDLDFASLLSGWADKTVRVVVPIIILDELDGLKRSVTHNGAGGPATRFRSWRKPSPVSRVPGLLRGPAPDRGRGGVILDLLFDPAGHVRLPINDDEIIDRALAAQALAGTAVTLLTFDTSQAARARNAGLRVIKLAVPVGEEKQETRNRKANRAAAAS